MSKISQLHAELTEQAAEMGFESIEQAEENGFKVDYNKHKLVPDADKAYASLEETEKQMREAKKIELVYEYLGKAKDMIALVYKPEDKAYCNPSKDITDDKIREYYYQINEMCCEIIDRRAMLWQKEDNEN